MLPSCIAVGNHRVTTPPLLAACGPVPLIGGCRKPKDTPGSEDRMSEIVSKIWMGNHSMGITTSH